MKFFASILTLVWLNACSAFGLVYYSSDGVGFNTNAPTGSLADSGWQYTGKLHVYTGTAISSNALITAAHLNPYTPVGSAFVYQGESYTTTSRVSDVGSDLAVWRVDGTFTNWAPILLDESPLAKHGVYFGRGMERGYEVVSGSITNGWAVGGHQRILRWGENQIDALADYAESGDDLLLGASFDYGAGTNECMLSRGDSGGGLFVESDGEWRLAGVHYSIDPAYFSHSSSGSPKIEGTMYDYSGLYYESGTNWIYATAGETNRPSWMYSTHVAKRRDWLAEVVPELGLKVAEGTVLLVH